MSAVWPHLPALQVVIPLVGALLAGFYLISEAGVELSFRLAAATNIAIGIVAVVAAYSMPPQSEAETSLMRQERRKVSPGLLVACDPTQRRVVLWTFFVSGVMLVE